MSTPPDVHPTDARMPVDNKPLIEYLSTEISTLSTNIMTFRTRITFSIFIGPFLILGSLIIFFAKEPLKFGLVTGWGWSIVIATVIAVGGFVFFGVIAGRIEQGALEQCNKWRTCIIRLQMNEQLSTEQLGEAIKDKQSWSATWVYVFAYIAILATFASTVYLASKFVHRT